jgi:hypothetical protein
VIFVIPTDGHTLPKSLPKDRSLPSIIVKVQDRGWIAEELFLEWLNVVWKKWTGTLIHKHTI